MKIAVKYKLFAIILILSLACNSKQATESADQSSPTEKPENVILMIGDGMGLAQITAGWVANQQLYIEKTTHTGLVKTNAADNLITDSAAGATAMATGTKSYNGAIGVDTTKTPVKNIVEIVEEKGYNTGLVATSSITHATPAGFYSHQESRKYDEAIAMDLIYSGVDLFIGGGKKFFETRADGNNLLDSLINRNYQLISNLDEVQNLASEKFGYFIADEQPLSYISGRGNLLPTATEASIQFLSGKEKPFFLMVEGSQIDWGGHKNDMKYVITEMLDFDRAINKALQFAEQDGKTLVVITADHETGGMYLTGGDISTKFIEADFGVGGHTPIMVPVFAFGPGAEEFTGIMDNTDIFHKINNLLQE